MESLEHKSVLITGGTGSFGSTMSRFLLQDGIAEVRILSRDEAKQDALRHELADSRVKFFLGDVRDEHSCRSAVRGVDLVFQAAALKQVPSAEFFPLEAVKTNIIGSANILRLSMEEGVDSVVCLSTDKAVYPINAMGMSKALMEKTAQSFAREFQLGKTKIAVTRYGNVMYSRGSVIPHFIKQIKAGKSITITDPNMTRFLMSLSDSVDLVKHAFLSADPGDIFVRKAPACTIGDLAVALAELFDVQPSVTTIGFRHGEKLFESLLSTEEMSKAVDEGDYFRVPMDSRNLNYEAYFEQGTGSKIVDAYTSHNTTRLSVSEIKELLLTLPEVKFELGT